MDNTLLEQVNKHLIDHFGTTVTNKPLFRLIWSTGITEYRFSEFTDFYGDLFIRTVKEVREVLKYPFAQDRYILERLSLIHPKSAELGLRTDLKEDYTEVYTFQDKQGNPLPVTIDMVETAIYLYFKFFANVPIKNRIDLKLALEAKKILERKKKTREIIGDGSSPFGFVME